MVSGPEEGLSVDVLALLCFILAAAVFALCKHGRPVWADVPLGLVLLTVGFILQFVHATSHVFRIN